MAETTTKLIDDCKDAQSRLEDAIKGATNSMTNLENTVSDVERLKDNAELSVVSKLQESAVSSRTFAKGSLDRLELSIEKAKEPIKALESKIKTKGMLNIFKTQKSLGDAKDALEKAQEARDLAASKYKDLQKSFTTLSKRVDDQSERTTLIYVAGKIISDITNDVKKLFPASGKRIEEITKKVGVLKLGLEAFEKELKSKTPWTKAKQQKCLTGIKKVLSGLESCKSELDKVAGNVADALKPKRWDNFPQAEKDRTLRKTILEARKPQSVVLAKVDLERDLIQDYQTRCQSFEFDLSMLEISDEPKDEQAKTKLRRKVVDRLDFLCDVVKHGMDNFAKDIDELKSNAEAMKKFLMSPKTQTESDWDKLEDDKAYVELIGRQTAEQFGGIKRAFEAAQKLQKQFPDDEEIKQLLASGQKVYLEKTKNYKKLKDSLPTMIEFIDKVLQKRPKVD